MLYIYLQVLYYHGNLYVTGLMQAGGVFRCPSGLSCFTIRTMGFITTEPQSGTTLLTVVGINGGGLGSVEVMFQLIQ